ncbi:MAG: hypothetical protein E6Q83_13250 [Thiothrix sp.]|nr:MAG: hypothetical protein E6Q83_13250 [Thiothrix sp.]
MTPFDGNLTHQDNQFQDNIFENQIFNDKAIDSSPELIDPEFQINEARDPTIVRVNNAYQILAAAVMRAGQSKKELELKITETQRQIEQHHQRLLQLSEQVVEDQVEGLPEDEQTVTQQLDTMNGCIRGKHYTNLVNRLNELSQADYKGLPPLIDSMRAELDLIEIRAQKIKILEDLKEVYKNHQYFQKYYQQADQEFKKLLNQY